MKRLLLLTVLLFINSCSKSQQWPDETFKPEIKNSAYSIGKGPFVLVDEAHNNFHTIDYRYKPFANLLGRDGYVIKSATNKITEKLLSQCKIFVISVPTSKNKQSAYSDEEIKTLVSWVYKGGSLLLITDHMPDPPAIAKLAEAFGIEMLNGYVLNEDPNEEQGPIFFKRNNDTLANHPITEGREGLNEKIRLITSFTGCAFKAKEDFLPLMIFGTYKVSWMTKEEGRFPADTPKIDVEGWYQGGVLEKGKGRLAFFGEAGMFTAQMISKDKIKFGMNVPRAKENAQFLLNIFHWLSRIL